MIVSVHIPKTGGKTFETLLTNAFGEGCLFDYEANPTKKPYWIDFINASLFRFSKNQPAASAQCIQGHFLAIKYTYLRAARFATWVRDPLQLAPSLYFYWKRTPELMERHPLCRKLHEENLTMEQFAALPRFWNLQTKYFCGLPLEKFAFIGITEEYDRSIQLFKKVFSLPDEVGYTTQNFNPVKREAYRLDPSLETLLRRWHGKDIVLYEKCRQRFEKLCHQNGITGEHRTSNIEH
jgi:hypothetical protein